MCEVFPSFFPPLLFFQGFFSGLFSGPPFGSFFALRVESLPHPVFLVLFTSFLSRSFLLYLTFRSVFLVSVHVVFSNLIFQGVRSFRSSRHFLHCWTSLPFLEAFRGKRRGAMSCCSSRGNLSFWVPQDSPPPLRGVDVFLSPFIFESASLFGLLVSFLVFFFNAMFERLVPHVCLPLRIVHFFPDLYEERSPLPPLPGTSVAFLSPPFPFFCEFWDVFSFPSFFSPLERSSSCRYSASFSSFAVLCFYLHPLHSHDSSSHPLAP